MEVPPVMYRVYRERFYPLISNTMLEDLIHDTLVRLSQIGIEKVDESEAEGIYEKKGWDNLIILDACRYDFYREKIGNIDYRITLGSNSRDFIRETFSERDCSDTVYVSGNAHTDPKIFKEITGKYPDEVFHEIFQVHTNDWKDGEGPDTEAVVRDAGTANKLFPDKKLIVHFMKPHSPFIVKDEDLEITWEKVRQGEISSERAVNAYERNLDYILDGPLKDLLEILDGKTVVTADHGQFLGENNRWAHPGGCNEVPLRRVPWHEIK